MQRIKLFENFSIEEHEIEKVYEKWVNNNPNLFNILLEAQGMGEMEEDPDGDEGDDSWLSDSELTPGERRALQRDFQVITKEQLAALYLKALGKHEFGNPEEDKSGRTVSERIEQDVYVTGIPGIEPFCVDDWRSGKLYIGAAGLSDAIGLESKTTVTRTVNKFYLLLSTGSGSYEEVVYPKVIEAYDYLKNHRVDVIQSIAADAIQDPNTSTFHRSSMREKGISKEQGIQIGKSIHSLFLDLYKNPFFNKDVCKIQRNAIAKISKEISMETEQLNSFYKDYLVKNKMLDKFNWCSERRFA